MSALPLPASPSSPCRNCGAETTGAYCVDCGQSTRLHPPSVREFVHEFIGHYIALEGPLWRTLAMLLLRPGRLTVDYLEGRRARYIAPLRLYLTFSVLLVALSAWHHSEIRLGNESVRFSMKAQAGPDDRTVALKLMRGDPHTGWPALDRAIARVEAMTPDERDARMQEGVHRYLPYVLILYVPLFALVLQLAYRNRHRLYGEHLVVAFHAQTVLFIASLVSMLPLPPWAGYTVLALLAAHWFASMRTVYGGRLVFSLLRSALLLVMYLGLLLLMLFLLGPISLLL